MSKLARKRRLRRTLKQVTKFGIKAKSKHRSKSGRTGRVKTNKLKALKAEL